jgi:hypothetical protein
MRQPLEATIDADDPHDAAQTALGRAAALLSRFREISADRGALQVTWMDDHVPFPAAADLTDVAPRACI